MFGHKKILHLESYIICLLMNDDMREDHKQKLQEYTRQIKIADNSDFVFRVHEAVGYMVERLAISIPLIITATGMLLDYREKLGEIK